MEFATTDPVSEESRDHSGSVLDTTGVDCVLPQRHTSHPKVLRGLNQILLLFMFVYFARPQDWIPGLSDAPLAKIAGALGIVAFLLSLRYVRLRLPREVVYLILLVGHLFLTVPLSPVWRGGAFMKTLAFAKVAIIVTVMTSVVITLRHLCRLIFVQAASIAVIAGITVGKGHLYWRRLEGVLGGPYTNPNDLALAIAISLPLCLAMMLLSTSRVWKAAWTMAMLVMTYAVFLTGSRGGFLCLVVVTAVSLWEFAIRGRRRYLLVLTALASVVMWYWSSDVLRNRLQGTFNREDPTSAYGSAQARRQLFWRSVEVTAAHPLLGVGPGNFEEISGAWHVSHNTFTELSSEGGLPAFVLFLLIVSRGFGNLRKIKKLSRRRRDLVLLARALHASLAGYVIGALFTSSAYDFFPYFLVAYTTALLAIARAYRQTSSEHESASPNPFGLYAYTAEQ